MRVKLDLDRLPAAGTKRNDSHSRILASMTVTRIRVENFYRTYRRQIGDLPRLFPDHGLTLQSGRNLIKTMTLKSAGRRPLQVVVKAFDVPIRPLGFIYARLRPSKALRSFRYAKTLMTMGINTPEPIACIEYEDYGCLRQSYYICRYWPHDFDLTGLLYGRASGGQKTDILLEQLARFTFLQHQNGVLHLDYNPGNILTRVLGDTFEFSLVDLNRLRFQSMDVEARIFALVRLTTVAVHLQAIGREYARLYGADPDGFCQRLQEACSRFTASRRRMRRIRSWRVWI